MNTSDKKSKKEINGVNLIMQWMFWLSLVLFLAAMSFKLFTDPWIE